MIVRAFNEGDPAEGPAVLARAQLSGVVPDASGDLPNSPNLLTELAGTISNVGAMSFSDSIEEHLAGEADPAEATSGAYRMSAEWVALFAGLTDEQVRATSQRWARECDPGASNDAQATALVTSIRDVCRVARREKVPLIYTWTM